MILALVVAGAADLLKTGTDPLRLNQVYMVEASCIVLFVPAKNVIKAGVNL
jgi:hypothetical protein